MAELAPGTLIGDRYRVIALMATGGEARVYRALDEPAALEVALRLPLKKMAAQPRPPLPATWPTGWVRLLAEGSDETHGAYQVFELLNGKRLAETVAAAPLSRQEWTDFVRQSLDAVGALHALGLPHGDLHADNFFADGPQWKLLELPFLRVAAPPERSALFGSIHTFAPEQFDGAPPGFSTDLYALGCLYHFAACGAYPHPGASAQEVAIHCLRFEPENLTDRAPQLPATTCAWVMNLIARRQADRPPSIAAAYGMLGVA